MKRWGLGVSKVDWMITFDFVCKDLSETLTCGAGAPFSHANGSALPAGKSSEPVITCLYEETVITCVDGPASGGHFARELALPQELTFVGS